MAKELDKNWDYNSVEDKIYKKWQEKKAFAPKGGGTPADNFTIMMPPPNVTGVLHMGHALTFTLQDILVRYNRMKGKNTLFQAGTDHAGIATQMVVERQLDAQGISRHDLGREKFLDKVWEWKEKSGSTIVEQQKKIGTSADWDTARFTMDDGLSNAVKKVFIKLYNDKLIYRDNRLVNWDPKLNTAISDLEVEQVEVKGSMWYFKYPIVGETDKFITIGTTRPETLFGDTAIAVHPDDTRYQDVVGKQVKLPFTNRLIPIITDEYPDPEKGTGAVKITPAHDFNDNEVGKRNNLEYITVMNKDASMNENATAEFNGMDRFDARTLVVKRMEEMGLLVKIEENLMTVPYGDRSKVIIEPLLTEQWFVNAEVLAKPALEAVRSGKTKFIPENWNKTYYNWLDNIQPWCISRQLWWGHQIPAWYTENGEIVVAENEEQAYEIAKKDHGENVKLTQDPDVLDTWFSSALWPFATLGYPDNTQRLREHYPSTTLVTGFDIIFFWVARMMMMGIYFMDEVPFENVLVHALVRDEHGKKMSKSKGNVIDPLEIIEKYGSDALRFTMTSMAGQGRDVKLSESRVEGYRNFTTKLWNASRFCLMNEAKLDDDFNPKDVKLNLNKWIISKVINMGRDVAHGIDSFRFNDTANAQYQFTRGTFCDWYLELTKPVFYGDDQELIKETRSTIAWVLKHTLLYLHPVMPYVTEELYANIFASDENDMLITKEWAEFNDDLISEDAQKEVDWLIETITSLRSARDELNIAPKNLTPVVVIDANEQTKSYINNNKNVFERLTRMESITIGGNKDEVSKGAIQVNIFEATWFVKVAGIVDISHEKNRLEKSLEKIMKELGGINGRLSNKKFVDNAPKDVIDGVKAQQSELELKKNKANESLERLKSLM